MAGRQDNYDNYPPQGRKKRGKGNISIAGDKNDNEKHPPHLKGKAIGMFYANRHKSRRQEETEKRRTTLVVNESDFRYYNDVVKSIKRNPTTVLPLNSSTHFQDQYHKHLQPASHSDMTFDGHVYGSSSLDRELMQESNEKWKNEEYQKLFQMRRKLPIFKMKEEILDLIESNQVIVLSGETGCGKTTQLTQYILDHHIMNGNGSKCQIVCTQPRRISAITVAERVAVERVEPLETSVGYAIRLENHPPRKAGSILYCTTGIMLLRLNTDVNLENISHIVLDEAHERDLTTDFLMIILKDLLPRRPNLKVIIMSATINAELFANYFGGCPIISIPGFTYPVKKFMLEEILEMTQFPPNQVIMQKRGQKEQKHKRKKHNEMEEKDDDSNKRREEEFFNYLKHRFSQDTVRMLSYWNEEVINIKLIAHLIKHICMNKPEGAILVFLPGWKEISNVNVALQSNGFFCANKFLVIPLHSKLPTINQRSVFNRPPLGVRKIVLATNIAETSITIDDIVYVIDSGKIKISNYNEQQDLATLKSEWVSLANSQQRKGRAGRVQPGECYHLYTSFREEQLRPYILAEMLRTRLENICLQIKLLKLGKIEDFLSKAIEPPTALTLEHSISLLYKTNALDNYEVLTPLGFHLARLPLDPQTGKMILFGCMFGCLDPILTVAASLSFKDAFYIPLNKEFMVDRVKKKFAQDSFSDHIMMIAAFDGWEEAKQNGDPREYCHENFLSSQTLSFLSGLKNQLAHYLHDLHFLDTRNTKDPRYNNNSENKELIKAIICAGLYPNVARVVPNFSKKQNGFVYPPHISTQMDKRVEHHPMSVNQKVKQFPTEWLVFYHKVQSTGIMLYDTTCVNPFSLLFFGGDIEQTKTNLIVDSWMTLNCDLKYSKVLKDLKCEFNKLLEHKITHPGVTEWNREGKLLNVIIDLITNKKTHWVAENERNATPYLERDNSDTASSSHKERKFFFDQGYKKEPPQTQTPLRKNKYYNHLSKNSGRKNWYDQYD